MIGLQARLLGGSSPYLLGATVFFWAWVSILAAIGVKLAFWISEIDTGPGTVYWSANTSQPGHLATAFAIPLTLAAVAVQVRASVARRASLALIPRGEQRWARPAAVGILGASLITGALVSLLWGEFRSPLVEWSTMQFGLPEGVHGPIPTRPTTLGLIGVSVFGAAFGSWFARARTPLWLWLAVFAIPTLGASLPSLLAHAAGHPLIEAVLVAMGSAMFLVGMLSRFDPERPVLDLMQPREMFAPSKGRDRSVEIDVPESSSPLTAEQARDLERLVSPASHSRGLMVGIGVLLLMCVGLDTFDAEGRSGFSTFGWLAEALVGPTGAFEEKPFGSGLFAFCLATLLACYSAMRTCALESPLLYPYSRDELYRLRFQGAWSLAWRGALTTLVAGSALGVVALRLMGNGWNPRVTFLMGALSIGLGAAPWVSLSWSWRRNMSRYSLGALVPGILGGASGALFPTYRDWLAVPSNEVFLGIAIGIPGWFLLSRSLESSRTGDRSFA